MASMFKGRAENLFREGSVVWKERANRFALRCQNRSVNGVTKQTITVWLTEKEEQVGFISLLPNTTNLSLSFRI